MGIVAEYAHIAITMLESPPVSNIRNKADMAFCGVDENTDCHFNSMFIFMGTFSSCNGSY